MSSDDDLEQKIADALERRDLLLARSPRSVWPSAKRIVSTTVTVVLVPLLLSLGYGLLQAHVQLVLQDRRIGALEAQLPWWQRHSAEDEQKGK